MSDLIMMIGAPASGKTTFAHKLAKKKSNCIVLSSDEIRKSLYGDASVQGDGNLVFDILYRTAIDYLKQNYCVIVDATFCNKRNRIDAIERLRPYADKAIAEVMDIPYEECCRANMGRTRHVPEKVIEKMYNNLKKNPPTHKEGFDVVHVHVR